MATEAGESPQDSSGEEKVVLMRAHWRFVVFPIGYSVLFVVFLAWLAAVTLGNFWGRALWAVTAMVGLAACGRLAVLPFFRWFTKSYEVTTKRVIFRDSLQQQRPVELTKRTLPKLRKSVLDLLFGSGTLDFGDGYVMDHIPHVKRNQEIITQLIQNPPRDIQELRTRLARIDR